MVGVSACSLRSQRNGGARRRKQGGDGRRREASPQSHPRFAAAHTPVYAEACTIPQNARAFCGTPIPLGSAPLLASVARNPLMCGGCRPHTALLRCLCVFAPHRAPSSLVRLRPTLRSFVALCVAPHTAASHPTLRSFVACAGLLEFCPFL